MNIMECNAAARQIRLDCKGTVIAVGGSQRFFDFGIVINLPETVGSDGQSWGEHPKLYLYIVVAVFVLALAYFIGR